MTKKTTVYQKGFARSVKNGIVPQFFSLSKMKCVWNTFFSKENQHLREHKKRIPFSTAGFGLIELLIVVAIIGFMVKVMVDRNAETGTSVTDAPILAELTVLKSEARLFSITRLPESYAGICGEVNNEPSTSFGKGLITFANERHLAVGCADNQEFYVVVLAHQGETKTDTFCLDSHGSSGRVQDSGADILNRGRCI